VPTVGYEVLSENLVESAQIEVKIEEAPTILNSVISPDGQITLTFNQEMRVTKNLPNDHDMKMMIINDESIFEGRYYFLAPKKDNRQLNKTDENAFEWTIISMTETTLNLQIDFPNPLAVSSD
jgi:hypothetical protein